MEKSVNKIVKYVNENNFKMKEVDREILKLKDDISKKENLLNQQNQ
jgi:hypothetical protein